MEAAHAVSLSGLFGLSGDPRGEWFGGLAESMRGPAPDRRVVILNLFGTVLGETAWLGTFGDIESAKAKLNEILAVSPGYYVIFDQTTGEKIFAESTPEHS